MTMLMTRFRSGPLATFELPDLSWFPLLEPSIRVEEVVENGTYVLRAELPGIDPVKDVRITYLDGALRLVVTRTVEQHEGRRSEFHYGSFHRTITLPAGAQAETIGAKYADGILEITMAVGEPAAVGKHIPIAIINGKKTD